MRAAGAIELVPCRGYDEAEARAEGAWCPRRALYVLAIRPPDVRGRGDGEPSMVVELAPSVDGIASCPDRLVVA